MKVGTCNLLKFKRAARRLEMEPYEFAGLLVFLWDFAAQNALAGDVGKFENEDIASEIGYRGNPDELIKVLVEERWLDQHPDSQIRLVVHDWSDHVPDYLRKRAKRAGIEFLAGADRKPRRRQEAS